MQRHSLWKILLIPALIQIVLLILSIWLAIRFGDDLRDLIWAAPAAEGSALLSVLRSALGGLFTFALISIGLILFLILGPVVAGPFLDVVSEKTEERVSGESAAPEGLGNQLKVAVFSIGDALLLLGITMAGNVLLLTLHLIPGLGSILQVILSYAFTWVMLSLEYTGLSGNRRMVGIRDRYRVLRKHPMLMLGFGFAVYLMMFIPFLNIFLLGLAASGSSLMYLEYFPDRTVRE
ncbi:Sulfate transport system protein cysZ [Salinispira pacifica]|uniref:Sulfate transport system protein cysZ n=1 Tax=Salinispira pacifica TaxID=1307761 RepID=V5WLU7_9SPIO|nr:Sulfate transport system protein cysZ [Salinispira pacifica]